LTATIVGAWSRVLWPTTFVRRIISWAVRGRLATCAGHYFLRFF
jgi:hypothetical protein